MANDITQRDNIKYAKTITEQTSMCKNFEFMLKKVAKMLEKEGPIYTVWIKFQIGKDSKAIVFDSSSTDPTKNLIAQLEFNKTGAGVTNDFKLIIQYDPFNMGQETADIVEQLDEYVAQAMEINYDSGGDESDTLRGYIQYGYNAVSDASLVSPLYEFFLTSATTKVQFNSGISSYTFSGTSVLGASCDNLTNFKAIENKKLMDVIEETLYRYYGTSEYKPKHISDITPEDNIYKYKIDIPDNVYNEACQENINADAMTSITPWQYCSKLLEKYPLTQGEIDSGYYDNMGKLTFAERPRYVMYLDDSEKTIRINHIVPKIHTVEGTNKKLAEENKLHLDYCFYWGTQAQSLVIEWNPSVDTMLYLIRKARMLQLNKQNELARVENLTDLKNYITDQLVDVKDEINEMYDAELEIVGVPCDVPLGVEFSIKATILNSISRTSGVYMVTGCSDYIDNGGTFTSRLKLIRLRGLDDEVTDLKGNKTDTNLQAIADNLASVGDTAKNVIVAVGEQLLEKFKFNLGGGSGGGGGGTGGR